VKPVPAPILHMPAAPVPAAPVPVPPVAEQPPVESEHPDSPVPPEQLPHAWQPQPVEGPLPEGGVTTLLPLNEDAAPLPAAPVRARSGPHPE